MKILVITENYPPAQVGGYEIRSKEVNDGLLKFGHDIYVLTSGYPEISCNHLRYENIIFRLLHKRKKSKNIFPQIFNDIKDLKLLKKILVEKNPDIIYIWSIQNLSNAIFPYLSTLNIPIILDEGSSEYIHIYKIQQRGIYFYKNYSDSFIKSKLKGLIYFLAKILSNNKIKLDWKIPDDMQVIFNSNSAYEYTKKKVNRRINNYTIIHTGIDIEKFPFILHSPENDSVKIITPGRIKPIKGTLDSVKLLNFLINNNVPATLKIVGSIQSQEYLDEIFEYSKLRNIENFLEFIPMVSQDKLVDYYHSSDFCFVPSYLKPGFSRVPLEAMSCGSLVITYGNEGSNEIIINDKNGYIIPETDIISAAKIIKELSSDKKKYKDIVICAKELVKKDFSFESYINNLNNYLLNVNNYELSK